MRSVPIIVPLIGNEVLDQLLVTLIDKNSERFFHPVGRCNFLAEKSAYQISNQLIGSFVYDEFIYKFLTSKKLPYIKFYGSGPLL